MASYRIASFSIDGSTRYGAVVGDGMVDLSAHFAGDYPHCGKWWPPAR